jgi:hypothetical protein
MVYSSAATGNGGSMEDSFSVQASVAEVRSVLAETLTPEELEQLQLVESAKQQDPFEPSERGEAVTLVTAVIWAGKTIAGSIMGRVAYDALKKAYSVLEKRYGRSRMAETAPKD